MTATAIGKVQCSFCGKETRPFTCGGCSQNFCRVDLNKHLQTLGEQLDQTESKHDELRQKFLDQKNNPETHSLIQEINQWEEDSIQKIKQTANGCRQRLVNFKNKLIIGLEKQLNDLATQIKKIREENEFNEIDLNHFKQKLTKLEEELDNPTNVSIRQEPSSYINKIIVNMPLSKDTKWKQTAITIIGENNSGGELNQLNYPRNIFVDDDQTLYIADSWNHRILEWKSNATNGRIVAGGNGEGNETNQLYRPTDIIIDKENNSFLIADRYNRRVMRWSCVDNMTNGEIIISDIVCGGLVMDKDGSLYVSDSKKSEVKRWKKGEKYGTIVAGGNGKGDNLNQLNYPNYIFVDEDYSLYISDNYNDRVMKWLKDAKEGIVVAGGNGPGNSLTQLNSPEAIIVDQLGQIYIAEWRNHRVMRWCEGDKEGTIIVGGNGHGKESNQFQNPQGISFDLQGNLYVSDCNNHRIQKFEIDSNENNLFE